MSLPADVDVCVYGATPAGCAAAVACRQEGASVRLGEPSRWLGGILGAGIKPRQDCPMRAAVGGLTRERLFALGDTPPGIRNVAYASARMEPAFSVLREQEIDVRDLRAALAARGQRLEWPSDGGEAQ